MKILQEKNTYKDRSIRITHDFIIDTLKVIGPDKYSTRSQKPQTPNWITISNKTINNNQ